MSAIEAIVVLVTTASQTEAERIAKALVEDHLAACVTRAKGGVSFYRWQGKMQQAGEWLLVIKSRREVLERLVQRVKALHSYEVPEIIGLPVIGGNEDYLRWIDSEVPKPGS